MINRKLNSAVQGRQVRDFDVAVQGFSFIPICEVCGTHRQTVASDVAVETARRAAERSAVRAASLARGICYHEKITVDLALRVCALSAAVSAETDPHVRSFVACDNSGKMLCALKAREASCRTQGLFAPVEIDVSMSSEVATPRARLLASKNRERFHALHEGEELGVNG